jgi:hypothetical protein
MHEQGMVVTAWTHQAQASAPGDSRDYPVTPGDLPELVARISTEDLDEVVLARYRRADPPGGQVEAMYLDAGPAGRAAVTVKQEIAEATEWYSMRSTELGEAPERGIVGQQWVELPARLWLPIGAVLSAAQYFCEHGGRWPDGDWEMQAFET